MVETKIAKRYANALFLAAQERNIVENVEVDLVRIHETFKSNRDLELLLWHPKVPMERKKSILKMLFGSVILPLSLAFVNLLIEKRRIRLIEHVLQEYIALSKDAAGIVTGQVTTAVDLTEVEKYRIRESLRRLLVKKVELETIVDKSIIGGVLVRVGDKIIDGTLVNRIAVLSRDLKRMK